MSNFRVLRSVFQRSLRCSQFKIQTNALFGSLRYYGSKSLPTLTMYTKDQCSLCDDARAILEKYKHRYEFEEVYITDKGNEEWFKEYRYEIPVFHFNGSFLMKHKANEELLEEVLSKYENS